MSFLFKSTVCNLTKRKIISLFISISILSIFLIFQSISIFFIPRGIFNLNFIYPLGKINFLFLKIFSSSICILWLFICFVFIYKLFRVRRSKMFYKNNFLWYSLIILSILTFSLVPNIIPLNYLNILAISALATGLIYSK